MEIGLSQHQLKKRQIRQSVLTLLVFFASFFAHGEHFAEVEFDALTTFELHDCHLCQHGIDSPPAPLKLIATKENIFCIADADLQSVLLTPASYVYPLLRAPPLTL